MQIVCFLFFFFSNITFSSDHPSGHRILSDPPELLVTSDHETHYDFLVIGSGYGGSVAALRLAEMLHKRNAKTVGEHLAILERGKEWLPGDFPHEPFDLATTVRTPLNPLGLLDINMGQGQGDVDIVRASGLGGTSLINAAITLRPMANVWEQPQWPKAIREAYANGELEQYFSVAQKMLYPAYGFYTREIPKSKLHLGIFPSDVPTGELSLNINRIEAYNRFGVTQRECTNCGNCCSGCNVGAKNVLTVNYLPCAKDLGATIFTQIEVEFIEILANGDGVTKPRYRIHYIHHDAILGVPHSTQGTVTANNVFLGAGSAGSTAILLRSQDYIKFSSLLGTRVSANGDVLGFVYNGGNKTNIAGLSLEDSLAPSSLTSKSSKLVGPTISVYADYRAFNKGRPLEYQFVFLDGSIPRTFTADLAKILSGLKGVRFVGRSLSALWRVGKDIVCRFPPKDGALNHSMLLLACGHDSSGGKYMLTNDGDIYIHWPDAQNETSFQYIEQQMEAYAKRAGGIFIRNPRSTFWGGGKLQATHPLGGVPMGETVDTGVVNQWGQVFNPEGGVYDGLYVVDAAIIPRSLAAPPLITITMLAERAMNHFVRSHGCYSLMK